MYEVIVLKEGYTKPVSKGLMQSGGSITLLKGPQNIIVDTGSPWDRDLLLGALLGAGLQPRDVQFSICTHGGGDKVGNLNLFPEATHIVGSDVYRQGARFLHGFQEGIPYEIDDYVEIWPTPGHTGSDVSVIVKGTKLGVVAVAGDLFECLEDLEDPDLWQNSSEQPGQQEQSRIEVLRVADYIVPGHGAMFQVPPEFRQQMRVVMMREEHYVETCVDERGASSLVSQSQCVIVETD
ncbi:metallo-beta-lactamase domain-containing protein 1-like isoform X2 [Babylonia areolata]|uniref:metallo-beta-lactamase domain-containing protein 1-like isoform X2 n=1 Tax=Babylonia areolata TaxID=304850 RepID=UPI003FCFF7CB